MAVAKSQLLICILFVATVLVGIPTNFIAAQERVPTPKRPPAKAQLPPTQPVNSAQALYLIRSTLLTLNDANRSGNYTVLRDLAAPGFRAKNTASDLGQIFSELRRRKIDLSAVALLQPLLSTPPYLDPNKMLRLTGHIPTLPSQINFELTFQNVDNHWRLFGISVATAPAPQQTTATQQTEKSPSPERHRQK